MEAKRKREIENKQNRLLKKAAFGVMALCLLFVLNACRGVRSDDIETDFGTALVSISISPASLVLADPTTQQLTATGIYGNASTADITESVNWVSEYPAIATVSDEPSSDTNPKGQVKTVLTGSTTITARSGNIKSSTVLSVTSAVLQTIEVTPGYSSYASAVTPWVQMKATGIYTDGTIIDITEFATWSSGTTSVATVNNVSGERGLATNPNFGTSPATATTTITATFQGVSGSTDLTLTAATAVGNIGVTPIYPYLAQKTYQQFTGTMRLSDGTAQDTTKYAIWASGTPANATISNADSTRGLALLDSTNNGPAVISASLGAVASTATDLNVTNNYYLYNLEINPEFPGIAQGIPYQLKAIGTFKKTGANYFIAQDLTEWVSWSSSDTSLATISNATGSKGLVTLTKVPGAADRTATITVKSPILSTLTGSTTLTVKSNSLKLTSIAISPSNPTIHIDTKPTYKAYGTFSDGTNSYIQDISHAVIWSSSDTTVTVVSNESSTVGNTANRAGGATTITASLGDVSGDSAVTVKPTSYTWTGFTFTPATAAVGVRSDVQLTATATFSNGTDSFEQDVSEEILWTSAATANADISNADGTRGLVTGITTPATVTMTADWQSSTDTKAVITEDIANLNSIAITAASAAGPDGTTQLTTTATYVSTNTQDVTDLCIWSSSRPAVASVLNIPGSKGKVFSNGSGSTTITCRITDETATKDLSVTHEFTVN
jgi:trimeric autotransporter adhesin